MKKVENILNKKERNKNKKAFQKLKGFFRVVTSGIEPPTQGFSVLCSTN
jgi:hypothetical protein